MISWQTTIAGIVMILCGVALLTLHPTADNGVIAGGLIAAGIGLCRARDTHVSDEQAGAGVTKPPVVK